MPLRYTTEELLKEVRNRGVIPDTESQGWTDADLILYMNTEILTELVPRVSRLHEEFMVVTEILTLVSGDEFVPVPARAVGNSLRDVFVLSGGARSFLPRINREDLPAYQPVVASATGVSGYYIENTRIRIFPQISPASSVTQLEVAYRFRPSQLTLKDDSASFYRTVTARDTALNTITVSDGTPPPFAMNSLVDIHGANSGSEVKVWDNEITAIVGNTLTLADPIDGSDTRGGRRLVEVGDYVCTAETAAIPMLPREVHPILVQSAICRITESIDDQEKLQMHSGTLDRMLKSMEYNLGKRVDGRPNKIVNRHAPLWRQGNVQRRSL